MNGKQPGKQPGGQEPPGLAQEFTDQVEEPAAQSAGALVGRCHELGEDLLRVEVGVGALVAQLVAEEDEGRGRHPLRCGGEGGKNDLEVEDLPAPFETRALDRTKPAYV